MDTDEFLRQYETDLRAMTRADKGLINSLTMLAADHVSNGDIRMGIVRTIEKVVTTALAQHKLIPLYLMDSIVKNVGGAYSSLFMTNLTPTFCDAFGVVDNKTRQSFIKLLDTWQTQSVFSQQKNDEIRLRLAALLSAEASNERAQIPAPVIPPPNVAQPMAPPAHAPFPRHAMGNLPVNDVNPNFVHGFRGPASVQEQLAVSQSRVHSLLGTLQPGPPQIPMHLPPPMQAQHHPAPVIMQQGGWPQAPQPQMPMHPPQHHPMSMNMNQGFHHHPVQNNQFVQPLQPQHPQPGPQSHFPQPALAAPLPPPATPHPLQMTGFHPQQINLQPRVPDHSRPMQSTGSLFGTVRSLNANDLGSQDVSPVIRGLYDDQPHECKSDGRRFRAKEDLQKHLDKLFAINKARKDCTGIKERQWFRRMEDWVSCADVIERPATTPAQDVKDANRMEVEITMSVEKAAEEEENAEKVPAEEFDHGTRCADCFEELRRSYDAEEECWFFKGVLRVNPVGQKDEHGRILVHRKCFQPGNRYSGDVISPVPVTPRAGGPDQQWVSVKSEGGTG
uniref:CID domain-containing protein n=1 Tax=Cryptomonas curvata TaxID=233186 RepID=A0A7S0M748_9CRYP|mmetsp:Transcript_2757/g.5923  ORF Transcript_2757/g.5923 Transcript_2757/m.5923 type:complete len:560 (+) Transcript_2757:202-1881(+)|eukprot:CAMPEP_0172152678 /NCGR_PEP_ID=MMETSP1050-20130122/987_1 /TAXON_ID=233186 /ORGANISM="Cryptomonas curvata, Strain CCAP979/52" /LENGTH=559 /DNA_ID=CAMNT_0012821059 /DNA_START=194 /DNA_END=1873 /DNA_ORIENTATION=-